MLDPKILDEIASKITSSLPKSLTSIKKELDKNIRAGVENGLSKLNLVSREEFDIQSEVLARTRQKLEKLEQQVADLEAKNSKDRKSVV